MIEVWEAPALLCNTEKREALFRLRHTIFCERLRWTPASPDEREVDEYDPPYQSPIYFLANDTRGNLNGCLRLLPTTGPYMLRDTFPQLLDGSPAPSDPRVWEASRFAVDVPDYDNPHALAMSRTAAALLQGMCEFGLSIGINRYLVVITPAINTFVRRLGAQTTFVTGIHDLGGVKAVCASCEVSTAVLAAMQARSGMTKAITSIHRLSEGMSNAA